MKKILVIGCPGSGKTTFSMKLANHTRLPLVHLDRYYHDGRLWDPEPGRKREQWKYWVISQTKKREWIIDGNYKSTLDIRIREADTIIFMDYPRRLSLWRIFIRRLFSDGPRADMPSVWKEKVAGKLLRFAWSYNQEERPKVLELLEKSQSFKQVVVLRNPSESARFLAELAPTGSTSHPRSFRLRQGFGGSP